VRSLCCFALSLCISAFETVFFIFALLQMPQHVLSQAPPLLEAGACVGAACPGSRLDNRVDTSIMLTIQRHRGAPATKGIKLLAVAFRSVVYYMSL
jgi:hypothetical protein